MLRIVLLEQFSETVNATGNGLTVAAESLPARLSWAYVVPLPGGPKASYDHAIRLLEMRGVSGPPDEQAAYLFESGNRIFEDIRLSQFPDVREALQEFDRQLQWTPQSVNRWISLAHDSVARHSHSDAFLALLCALRRASVPYIRIRAKDDSSLKRRAAQQTFESGKEVDAIRMLEQIVQNRLSLLRDALK